MKRRNFLNSLFYASGAASLPMFSQPLLAQSPFNGKLLMVLQLDGGMDVTAFCDPKMNVNGEREINWWARNAETQTIGNLSYAPFASNQSFFEKYYQDMLVINGVDAQTNSHSVGVTNNWSGRNSIGFPSITSLYAASKAPEMPMSYLNFGGFGNTERIIRSSRVDDMRDLRVLTLPNDDEYSDAQFQRPDDIARIQQLHRQNLEQKFQHENVLSGNQNNRQYYYEALLRSDGLKEFASQLPPIEDFQQPKSVFPGHESYLTQQIQLSLIAFSAGVSVSSDLYEGGYDTHADNDYEQSSLLSNTTDAIDYLWTTAEEMGLADRIILLIGSDFGRTPYYNSADGKDHWPIGSYIVMERNANYTNRVIGETDEGHNTKKINLQDGMPDPIDGITILPAHVHLALRKYLGIHNNGLTDRFPFTGTEDFAFFM